MNTSPTTPRADASALPAAFKVIQTCLADLDIVGYRPAANAGIDALGVVRAHGESLAAEVLALRAALERIEQHLRVLPYNETADGAFVRESLISARLALAGKAAP